MKSAQTDNLDEVIKELKKAVIDHDGLENMATYCNTSVAYLRKVFRKERSPSKIMLDAIGYKLVYTKA